MKKWPSFILNVLFLVIGFLAVLCERRQVYGYAMMASTELRVAFVHLFGSYMELHVAPNLFRDFTPIDVERKMTGFPRNGMTLKSDICYSFHLFIFIYLFIFFRSSIKQKQHINTMTCEQDSPGSNEH